MLISNSTLISPTKLLENAAHFVRALFPIALWLVVAHLL